MGVRFEYLYRDASNYKNVRSVTFEGSYDTSQRARLSRALADGENFVAEQVGLPSAQHFANGDYPANEDDHGWHEFVSLTKIVLPPTDPRTFEEFVQACERAALEGWRPAAVEPDPLLSEYRKWLDRASAAEPMRFVDWKHRRRFQDENPAPNTVFAHHRSAEFRDNDLQREDLE